MTECGEGFAIVVSEEKDLVDIPSLLIPFLEKFGDVFPMRDMQHCIDLVLGSSLLNKPSYRMNLKEHVEL